MSSLRVENDRLTPDDIALRASLRMLKEINDLRRGDDHVIPKQPFLPHKSATALTMLATTLFELEAKRIHQVSENEIEQINENQNKVEQLNFGFVDNGKTKFTEIVIFNHKQKPEQSYGQKNRIITRRQNRRIVTRFISKSR